MGQSLNVLPAMGPILLCSIKSISWKRQKFAVKWLLGATDGAAVNKRALRFGFFVRRFAKCIGLQLGMIGEQVFVEDLDFVVREIRFGEVGTLFKDHDAETVGG